MTVREGFFVIVRKIPFYRDRTHVPMCQKVTRLPLSYRGNRQIILIVTYVCMYVYACM